MWKEDVFAYFRYYPEIIMEGLRNMSHSEGGREMPYLNVVLVVEEIGKIKTIHTIQC